MNQDDPRFTREERFLISVSDDTRTARRRIRGVVLSGAALAIVLLVTGPLIRSWKFLLAFAVAYVAVSTWERVRWARTILTYKELVRKLSEGMEAGRPGARDSEARGT